MTDLNRGIMKFKGADSPVAIAFFHAALRLYRSSNFVGIAVCLRSQLGMVKIRHGQGVVVGRMSPNSIHQSFVACCLS
ncbi:MAG: hypothetical protein HC833_04425 [Leptolyngbyaceae cyanobacterium RM1_406_9]|nr:hypothetical protein [Leptolyngbyaceae cyanobacterium RM1_406_9]